MSSSIIYYREKKNTHSQKKTMRSFAFLLSIFLLLQLSSFTISQLDFYFSYCSDGVNYTTNSTYSRNIRSLLNSFDSNYKITGGFYNLSVGNPPNQVNGIALCRGDKSPEVCRYCFYYSTTKILQSCPNQMEAFGYYDNCMLSFSNRSILGINDQGFFPTYFVWNRQNVSDSEIDGFNQVLGSLLNNLTTSAASGNSTMKFATKSETSGIYTIYGLMQCTPDLSSRDCENCLVQAVSQVPRFFTRKTGGRVINPSCNLRYEIYPFYANAQTVAVSPLPPLPIPMSPSLPRGNSGKTGRTIVIIVVPIVGVVVLIICVCLFLRIRKPKRKFDVTIYKDVDEIEDVNSLQFDFETIRSATSGFSDQNRLGQGGFGAVYKGTLTSGQDIAVKRLSQNSGQGELEFKNEVVLVAKLQHRNLVRLLGFCLERNERLLIYEFVPNASLDHFIFDSIKRKCLDWDKRNNIINGIAKGLLYLHEDSRLRIVHRDMKTSNILLDEDMNPKIADFGMARLFIVGQTQGNTNRIVGT